MLTVVCWKWYTPGFRTTYTADHVNTFARMVRRHYQHPHRIVCVTDDTTGIDSSIQTVPLWPDYHEVVSPHGPKQPACYVRIKAFAPEMRAVFGERFVSVDLDCVITGDVSPLWNRRDQFVIWWLNLPMGRCVQTKYQGSMWMMDTGARKQVWESFRGERAARRAFDAGHHGNDQGWMHYVLGDGEARWTDADGVYSYKYQVCARHGGHLPENARIVFFHGKPDAWDPEAYTRHEWIRQHYC